MEAWMDLCRCCLSPDCEVSLLDEENLKEKWSEITTLQVNQTDGLPQRICEGCLTLLNTAHQFRVQCIKMDTELKISQMKSPNTYVGPENGSVEESEQNIHKKQNINHIDSSVDQILSIIKKEHTDSDDDYYVLVIDDPKQIENNETDVTVKEEPVTSHDPEVQVQESEDSQDTRSFENSYDFLDTTRVPVNVPATILENEEESPEAEVTYSMAMEVEDSQTQDSTSQPDSVLPDGDELASQENSQADLQYSTGVDDNKNSIIKILTTAPDGTIMLRNQDGEGDIQYLTDGMVMSMGNEGDDADQSNQAEVIFCEGEDSRFQILKCDGSELVIEYAGEEGDQIATVLQQDDGTFLCECGEECEDLAEYEKHQHKHNPGGEHLCNLCGKGFEGSEILTGHMLLHGVQGVLVSCPFCNQLIRRNSLTQHIKYSHMNIKPQCNVCTKTFANPNNLKRHMMIHSGVREFECDVCFRRFHQKITMQTHRLTHMNPFSCNHCDQAFGSKIDLTKHKESDECNKSKVKKVKEEIMKTAKQEITTNLGKLLGYACSLCKKMFSQESVLEQHIESTHMVDPSELLCAECGEVFLSKKEMQTHIMTHKTYKQRNCKRFECSECGKGCSSQAMLIMHARVHTNERPYPCALCSLRFKTKTHLRTHQLTHTREKKFGCSVCMKFFALKGNLVVHLRTHTGERPYVCPLCGDAFIDSKYLKKHKLKKHAGDQMNQY